MIFFINKNVNKEKEKKSNLNIYTKDKEARIIINRIDAYLPIMWN